MNWPDRVIFFYMFLTCTLVGALFVDGYTKSNFFIGQNNAVAVFYNFLLISGIVVPIKAFLLIFYYKSGTETLRKCKINRLIGFGGIIFFAHFPRVLVYFGRKWDFLISIATISLIGCSMFYLLFASGMESVIRWNESKNKTLYKVLDFLCAAGLALSCLGATEFSEFGRRAVMEIVGCQLGFFALGYFSLKEFCGVVNGSMELKKKDMEVELESVKVVGGDDKDVKDEDEHVKDEKTGKSELRLECNICAIDYDYKTRIPRILSSCGHTICEACITRIMGKKKSISCPFCQKMTVIFEKSASELPKNYETIAAMEWKMNN